MPGARAFFGLDPAGLAKLRAGTSDCMISGRRVGRITCSNWRCWSASIRMRLSGARARTGHRTRIIGDAMRFSDAKRRRFEQVRHSLDRLADAMALRRIIEIRRPLCGGTSSSDGTGVGQVILCPGSGQRPDYFVRDINAGRWAGAWRRCSAAPDPAETALGMASDQFLKSIKSAQALVRKYVPPEADLVAELTADRRAEVQAEETGD
jgi:hypothetical protein